MNNYRTLAVILTFVLVAGFGTAAYGQNLASDNGGSPGNATPLATPESSHNVIFDGGDPDLAQGWLFSSGVVADDFVCRPHFFR